MTTTAPAGPAPDAATVPDAARSPEAGRRGEAWIDVVPPDEATGLLAEQYARQVDAIGHVTALTQAGSLYPDLVKARLDLYAVVDATPSGVPEHVRRGVALLTSVLNGCWFCTVGHTERLVEQGRGDLAEAIKADPEGFTTGDPAADAAYAYTRVLVRTPREVTPDLVDRLREVGYTDLDVLDLNNLAAYYSYVNRVAAGLGLQREA